MRKDSTIVCATSTITGADGASLMCQVLMLKYLGASLGQTFTQSIICLVSIGQILARSTI